MKIVFLNGGLANQTFQYIMYRHAQLRCPEDEWYLDDSFFFVHQSHNGYELKKVFNLNPSLLSEYFDSDVWEYMMQMKSEQGLSIPTQLNLSGAEPQLYMIAEGDNYSIWNPFDDLVINNLLNRPDADIIYYPGNVYYHGYWLYDYWFNGFRELFLSQLVFPPIEDDYNRSLLDHIISDNAVSIHIRRGDFNSMGLAWEDSDYKGRIEQMAGFIPGMKLIVFSDDLNYCRSHSSELGLDLASSVIYAEGNTGENAFRDMQLMSLCPNMILSNSSFCYLASLLNRNLKNIILPSNRTLERKAHPGIEKIIFP